MGYVEAASVLYLRTIYGGVDPVGPRRPPFRPIPDFTWVEICREAATIVMLAAVGWLAGRRVGGRLGAFAAAFGTWDIFYYAFLWLFSGWPASPFAPDVLFIIPLPWWGPVASPMLIALLMVVGGGLALARDFGDGVPRLHVASWVAMVSGALLCLGAFMADALLAMPRGLDAALSARGSAFLWAVYLPGLAIGAWGTWRAVTRPRLEGPPLLEGEAGRRPGEGALSPPGLSQEARGTPSPQPSPPGRGSWTPHQGPLPQKGANRSG